jgi:uncharacterized cupin superfamily protein
MYDHIVTHVIESLLTDQEEPAVVDYSANPSLHVDTTGDEGYRPSAYLFTEDGEPSRNLDILDVPSPEGTTHVGIWWAQPGVYNHPGGGHETFYVFEGEAEFDLPDGTVHLAPGSVAHIPANTPTQMRVTKDLRKIAFVVRPNS